MDTSTTPQANAPSAPASRESIRDQFMRNLAAERSPAERHPEPPQSDSEATYAEPTPVHEEDDVTASQVDTEPSEATEEAGSPDDDPEAFYESLPDSVKEVIQRTYERERLQQADYTRKTQKIAEAGRQLEQDSMTIRKTAEFVASVIDAPVKQMESMDWASLRTADPAAYQEHRKRYEATVNARDGLLRQLAQMEKAHDEALERHKRQVAEVSRDILRSKIPNWGPQRYSELREFAVNEFGYTPEEIDQSTDHRFVELLNEVSRYRSAMAGLNKVTRKPEKAKPQNGNRPQHRNEAGRFQSARQNLTQRPGDRNAARDFFKAKLAAERKRNGG